LDTTNVFRNFEFCDELQEGLDSMGFKNPTPIQLKAIPRILAGKDIIGCAQTGTGKTGAYVLPILEKILNSPVAKINTLILAPTRELALQIDQQIEGFAYFTGCSSRAIYGGGDGATWDQQKKALTEGADIIIATPGRLIAHLTSYNVDFSDLKHLILDEADRMLDMGFHEDIMKIIGYLPTTRQTLLFSATMPSKIKSLADKILKEPEEISISISKPAENIVQKAYNVFEENKTSLLTQVLEDENFETIILFCSTKEKVKKLYNVLKQKGQAVQAFHSDLEQTEREQIMRDFRSGKVKLLIGTDVLSRGIDVEGIDLVINFDVPPDPEDYIHRIGRTARAKASGTAITFISPTDQFRFSKIENLIQKEIEKLPQPIAFGEGPEYNPSKKQSAGPGRSGKPRYNNSKQGGGRNQNKPTNKPNS
jgi:ATP-dependent RNA helicase RhlE